MSYQEYFDHYFKNSEIWVFLMMSALLFLIVMTLLFFYGKMTVDKVSEDNPNPLRKRTYMLSESFFELIFSGTSILSFMTVYYLIERFLDIPEYVKIWQKYGDFLLLLFIVLSCIFNSLLDRVFVRLKHLDRSAIASVRLIGMLYMILIFCYIKFIYENNNYDYFITYFLGLMVGRFVYFDATFMDFLKAVGDALKYIPVMFFALACTGVLCWYGFTTKYLIKHIGVITNVFLVHLFMCIAIFILYHSHIIDLITFKKRRKDAYRFPED